MKNLLIAITPNAARIDGSFHLLLGYLFVFFNLVTFSVTPVYSQQTLPTANIINGNAVNLDGINDYIRVNPNPSLQPQAPLSLEIWAFMSDWNSGTTLKTGLMSKIEHGVGGYEIGLDSNGSKTIGINILKCGGRSIQALRSRVNLSSGWHHFAATFDGRYLKFYTDGVLSATTDAGSQCLISYIYSYELRFGRSAFNESYGNNYFKGKIDEARIYNKVLSVTEISDHYNAGLGQTGVITEPGLIAGWHFDENTGINAADFSGKNLPGTLVNGGVWVPRNDAANTIGTIWTSPIGVSSASINWLTNLPANSLLEYGTTTSYGQTVTLSAFSTDHLINLTGLLPFTTYHFKVTSVGQNGQTATSADQTFVTLDRTPTNNQFYVAPNGSSTGNGAIGSPWDLQTALNHPSIVQPGATIWMRGGTYLVPEVEGGFVGNLNGTPQAPIVVRSFPGEWAVIDGNLSNVEIKYTTMLKNYGSYIWFMNFEMTNSETTNRKIDISGSNPFQRRANSLDDYGTGTKVINLVIHDTGQGIGAWQQGKDNEYYGNIVYNNGWDAPDRLHGHGTYTQNDDGYKHFTDNFFFNQFGVNSRTGGTDASAVRNYTWTGNAFFNGGMSWLGPHLENLKVIENYTYNQTFKVGNEVNSTYLDAEVRKNYFTRGVELFEFNTGLKFHENTVWNTYPFGKNLVLSTSAAYPASTSFLKNNTYYQSFRQFPYWQFRINIYPRENGQKLREFDALTSFAGDYAFNSTQGTQALTFGYTRKSWQGDAGLDVDSTYIDNAPTGTKVFVRPNNYEPNRANIIIYNWDKANTVAADVSSVLNPGDSYELRNVQDYFGDVITGIYSGGELIIPMTGRTRAKPLGYDQVTSWYHDPLQPNTFPEFGGFVIKKIN